MKQHERLKYLRKELNLTQKELGEILGVAPTTYAMFELGRRNFKANYIKILKYQFNVNEDWLIRGEGDPFYITPEKNRLIEQFDKMSSAMQKYYLEISEQLIELESKLLKRQ